MDGYATLNGQQFEMALERAIDNLKPEIERLIALDKEIRQEMYDKLWAKRSTMFGPWTEKGCWRRVQDNLGMFGNTSAGFRLHTVKGVLAGYEEQLKRINVMNAEPYLISLKHFNTLMSWAK